MQPPGKTRPGATRLACLLLGVGVGLGCTALPIAGLGGFAPRAYDYFARPAPDDPWSPKIAGWQRREAADAPTDATAPASVAGAGGASVDERADGLELRSKYASFRAERRREVAREFAVWIQSEAQKHYIPDGPVDHWATLEETLRHDGDDCDGLELLVYHGLRDLGFAADEVYRAIVVRPSDGQHHMVTLWFEDRDDPWVVDPTGAMSSGLRRMSQIPGWRPLKVFSEDEEFSALPGLPAHGALAAR